MSAIPVLPESSPFSTSQRAWLNGFFAGVVSRGDAATSVAGLHEEPSATVVPQAAVEDEAMPWHDAALSMEERLKLAEGKPKARVLMAAMAQLDCGACGYLCQTYAEALAKGEEKDLTRCAPGGRDTSRKLKELVVILPADKVTIGGASIEARSAPSAPREAAATIAPSAPSSSGSASAHDRRNPFPARLLRNQRLNAPGSAKDTRLIVFDLHGSGLTYRAGDALGVVPENCPDMVNWIIDAIDAVGDETITTFDGKSLSLHDALLRYFTITQPSDELLKLLADSAGDPAQASALSAMANGDGAPPGVEILDLLNRFSSARPNVNDFVATLLPLSPRLYSISSSPKACHDEVHLTVGVVRYLNSHGRQCKGTASTYLAERLRPGQKVKVFVNPSHGFAPPSNSKAPMIMVGPGTGIAPFRAFLQERVATGAAGRNWLFFGDQKREQDFLYREEIENWLVGGVLTRLDTAFSRDQHDKVYVQHRMMEKSREIWAWLNEGAHFYVCGDANRMAKDVDAALKKIVSEQGGMSDEAAAEYVADMTKAKRYARDVY